MSGEGVRQVEDDGDHTDGEQEEGEEVVFSCQLDSVTSILSILSALPMTKGQKVEVRAFQGCLKFSCAPNTNMIGKAFVTDALFRKFELAPSVASEGVSFVVSLPTLYQCLQIFGDHATMQLSYNGEGTPLNVILEHQGVITQCEIQTYEERVLGFGRGQDSDIKAQTVSDVSFAAHPLCGRAVLRSDFLKDCWQDLDLPGSQNLFVEMSPEAPSLIMHTSSDLSSVEVVFPEMNPDRQTEQTTHDDDESKEGKQTAGNDVFIDFECSKAKTAVFDVKLIHPCLRALGKAEQTSLRLNERGMLSMQHMIPASSGNIRNWVEFILLPNENESAPSEDPGET